ncbi:MAG: M23 family metallopeptidase [Candidatus Marinimicrobia bacterium]|nr:M23 family metallopeptidase [Candidatus Neomarinimicrobiota bacterium]
MTQNKRNISTKRDDGFRFFLINDKKNLVNEFFFPKTWVLGLSFVGLFTIMGLGAFFFSSLSSAQYNLKVQGLKSQNKELVRVMEDLKIRLDDAEIQLTELVVQDEALRVYANLPSVDADVRAGGTGGAVNDYIQSYDKLIPVTDLDVNSLESNMASLGREITLQLNSYEQIYSKLSQDIDRLRQTPSIPPVNRGYLTSSFGVRTDPFTRKRRMHHGQDFGVLTGTPVYATADGIVKSRKGNTGYGNTVVLNHGYGIKTVYAHLSRYAVNPGDTVKRGELIAYSGNTGRSTGPHLHYEVRVNNVPVNPRHYFLLDKIEL